MKNNHNNEAIKLRVEYANPLGMPVTVTRKVPCGQLQEFLETHHAKVVAPCKNTRN